MMISTRGRYALRVLIDLAEHNTGEFIPLKEVAARQEISLKYIEKIMPLLSKAGYVICMHGKRGGYRLLKDPADYSVGDILRLTEGELAPVSCLMPDAPPCKRAAHCKTLRMWRDYFKMTNDYFDNIKITDLANIQNMPDFVI